MRKFNHTAHRALWIWLSENPKKGKENWPGWEYYDDVENDCFACEFSIDKNCRDCPLIWPGGDCMSGEALYNKWGPARFRPQERASLALQIANLPVKEGVETE